ncbi:MAG: PepSY-associated TM helix domain-containing protein, partial [Bryobacteraceae bacterium]
MTVSEPNAATETLPAGSASLWERWMRRPQSVWLRKAMFQLHLWIGIAIGVYIVVVCVSGSLLVFRNDLYDTFDSWTKAGPTPKQQSVMKVGYVAMRWMADLHGKLLLKYDGMWYNAIGGFVTAFLCLTGLIVWWPGGGRWKRALGFRMDAGWKRLNFDMHSSVGFWTFLILFVWGMTGGYFVFPEPFRAAVNTFAPINPPAPP